MGNFLDAPVAGHHAFPSSKVHIRVLSFVWRGEVNRSPKMPEPECLGRREDEKSLWDVNHMGKCSDINSSMLKSKFNGLQCRPYVHTKLALL